MEQKTLRIGAAVLVLALLLRLVGTREWGRQELAKTLLFFSTGRLISETVPPETAEVVEETVAKASEELPEESVTVPVFGEGDAALVQVSGREVDIPALLQAPLQWDLTADKPTVLILHTHASESYEKEAAYTETAPYRTLDNRYNMVSIGARVAQILESGGIRVIHDETIHDYPSYNDAYDNSRQTIEKHLAENPQIALVLDLHRDASEDADGNQTSYGVTIGGEATANLMLVMGSDTWNLPYPNWERNLALAVKLQAALEQMYPGLCRPVKLVDSRYNQDLSEGTLLVEVGMAGNTHQEALRAAELLAEGILSLAQGANFSV